MTKPENDYWLSTLHSLPVGYAKIKIPSPNGLINEPSLGQLQKIYVLSEFLELRIGRALLDAVMQQAAVSQVKMMWLSVLESNERAIEFYERNGLTVAGRTTFAIGSQNFTFLVLKTALYKNI